jgi:hypothetical protein
MQSGQGLWQALIIACQPAKPGCPGKTAPDHPTARQEDKALLHIRLEVIKLPDAFAFDG